MTKFMLLKDYTGNPVVFEKNKSRVKLYNKNYGPQASNPVFGTIYETTGTVVKLGADKRYPISVQWDNGTQNSYKEGDLMVLNHSEITGLGPNETFRLKQGKRPKPKLGYHAWKEKKFNDNF
jgi:hypothetical protein